MPGFFILAPKDSNSCNAADPQCVVTVGRTGDLIEGRIPVLQMLHFRAFIGPKHTNTYTGADSVIKVIHCIVSISDNSHCKIQNGG